MCHFGRFLTSWKKHEINDVYILSFVTFSALIFRECHVRSNVNTLQSKSQGI